MFKAISVKCYSCECPSSAYTLKHLKAEVIVVCQECTARKPNYATLKPYKKGDDFTFARDDAYSAILRA